MNDHIDQQQPLQAAADVSRRGWAPREHGDVTAGQLFIYSSDVISGR